MISSHGSLNEEFSTFGGRSVKVRSQWMNYLQNYELLKLLELESLK